jgi:hypothetical protein
MWRTRQKLGEAKFFLDKLDEHCYENLAERFADPRVSEAFPYYLSAFISAARSVTWILRSEYGRFPDWKAWWNSEVPAAHVAQLLRLFTELRNRSQKAEPLRPGPILRIEGDGGPPVVRDPKLPRMKITISGADDEPAAPIMSGELLAFTWTIEDLDGQDLLESCRTYYEELKRLVASCEARFAK